MNVPESIAHEIVLQAATEPYRQSTVMNSRLFSNWLSSRGLHLRWQVLHHLALSGALHPVSVLESSGLDIAQKRYLEIDLVSQSGTYIDLGREVQTSDLAPLPSLLEVPSSLSMAMFWHPFQLWEIQQIARRLELPIATEAILSDSQSFDDLVSQSRSAGLGRIVDFANSNDHLEFLKILAVLLFAEPIVKDKVSTKVQVNAYPLGETFEGYFEWRSEKDGVSILNRLGIETNSLKEWHQRLALAAQSVDPLGSWRTLVRQIPREKRLRLSDKALQAEEFYYAAEVLRRYLEQYHNMLDLPEEDDVDHPQQGAAAKEQLFGKRRTSDFDRSVFRNIVRQFDLDPQPRLRWLVEGDTEVGFALQIAQHYHIDLEHAGIELVNLHGLGGLESDRTYTLLSISQQEEVFTFMSIDYDKIEKNPGILYTYAQKKLLLAGFKIYRPDFETANFNVEELAEVANALARSGGIECSVTPNNIRSGMENGTPAGLVIERLWRSCKFYGGKGSQWGKALADFAFQNQLLIPAQGADEERPAITVFKMMLRAQRSNYKFTAEKSYVDRHGKVINYGT